LLHPYRAQQPVRALAPSPRALTAAALCLLLAAPQAALAAKSQKPHAAPHAAPQPAAAPAEEPVGPFTWDGFYVGTNLGGGFGAGGDRASGFATDAFAAPSSLFSFAAPVSGGVLGGLQAGYNWQFDRAVLGVEADMQAAGLSGTASGLGLGGAAPLAVAHQTIDWFGTFRGRIGWTATPTLLLYGTGGLAVGGGSGQFSTLDSANNNGDIVQSPTHLGFAVGGGLEWAFAPEWSAKAEYLYVDLGRRPGYFVNLSDDAGDPIPNVAGLSGHRDAFHVMRVGLNYRFSPNSPNFAEAITQPLFLADRSDKFHEIDTKYLFGFTDGADIDAEGEKELEFRTLADFGRRRRILSPDDADFVPQMLGRYQGSYRAISQKVEFEHTPTQNFQYSLGVSGVHHHIRGVDGFDDLDNVSLGGLSAEGRYVILGRGPASPVGLTLQVEPEWGHVSEMSGQQEHSVELETKLIADTELIANRLYAATNLLYLPEVSRGFGETKWGRESTIGVTGALVWRATPGVAIGGDVQYYRHHTDGFWLNRLDGQAVYVGPNLHLRLSKKIIMTAAFATQLRGHAAGEDHAYDLLNYARHRAQLRFIVEF
jgi:opacity protein-like surface antigen